MLFRINHNKQEGQTLIETMVASLVLVMGISAAVSLAVYGLGATSTITKQVVGVGLAREGIEAVKNMRDSNWLNGVLSPDCYDFYTANSDGANCYKDWQGARYSIGPGTYRLSFDSSSPEASYWQFLSEADDFGLQFSEAGGSNGFYLGNGRGGSSDYYRKITISEDQIANVFDDPELGPRLKVRVDVWWTDKRCPASADVPDSNSCKVTLETYLTNWKNY